MGGNLCSFCLIHAKRELRQASRLTVDHVKALEHVMVSEDRIDADKVIAGALLMCVHGRARFGDLARADQEPILDVCGGQGFLEVV